MLSIPHSRKYVYAIYPSNRSQLISQFINNHDCSALLKWHVTPRWKGSTGVQSHFRHLCLLLFGGINNGGAAHFSYLAALPVEGPAADLIPDHIFDEEYTAIEPQRQLVKQLDIFQHVVVRIAEGKKKLNKSTLIIYIRFESWNALLKKCQALRIGDSPGVGIFVIASVIQQFDCRLGRHNKCVSSNWQNGLGLEYHDARYLIWSCNKLLLLLGWCHERHFT